MPRESPSASRKELPLAPLPSEHQRNQKARALRPDDWFDDYTERAGVRFAYRDGNEARWYTLLETVGGGAALFDFDRDGDLDLFLVGGGEFLEKPQRIAGRPCALYRNDGDWRFTDVSAAAGVADTGFYSHGATVGDFDRDGFPDLFVTGLGGVRLYRNRHDGTFEDVTKTSRLDCPGWNTAAAWADVDRDGWLDLFVVTYANWELTKPEVCTQEHPLGKVRDACAPTRFPGARDSLWRNRGNGTFEDVSAAAGLSSERRGMGIVAADFDEDGWIDFYVANDVHENDLYFGGPQLPLVESAVLAGAAFSASGEREGSMGVDVGDADGDGRADLFYTNFAGQDDSLLQQFDNRGFLNVSDRYGLAAPTRKWVGFGAGFVDFDSDGWLDLFVANGHVLYAPQGNSYFQPAQLFRNQAGKRFTEVTGSGGPYFSIPHAGRGAAVGDLDNDGAPDLVIVHQNDPVSLLRNQLPAGRWVRVELRGVKSNTDAVGAKVTAPFGERTLTRYVRGGGGYLSYFDPRVLLPAAGDEPLDVTVVWPSGEREVFTGLDQRKTHELVEGTGRAAR